MNMNNELRNHWQSLLQPLFPDGAKIKVPNPEASDFLAKVFWSIESDPDRPNKMSKTIRIIVTDEAESDYLNKNDAQQQSDDMKLQEFIESRLAIHDPNHDNPREIDPPEVEWVAGSNILNS